MSVSKELAAAIKGTSPEIREYIAALRAENSRLVKQMAKVEAQLTTAGSMIAEYKKGNSPNPLHHMSDEELLKIAKGEE